MEPSPFAVLLKEHRNRLGLSRSQLSERSGLSYPYISQLETSLRKPSRKAAYALAQALEIDVSVLEGAIPSDDSNPLEIHRAQMFTDRMLGSSGPVAALAAMSGPIPRQRGSGGGLPDREELLGDMLDLLEEFDADDRLDALSELQKRTMQRMIEERGSR